MNNIFDNIDKNKEMLASVYNKDKFREFHTDKEAYEWAMNYFGSWINEMESIKENSDLNNAANLLDAYTSSLNVPINRLLRGYTEDFEEKQTEQYYKQISIISNEISKFSLQENIIVYRFTHEKLFSTLFESSEMKENTLFTEKGFMSTTLVRDLLIEFAKSHKYNCLLKLYLPNGTKGSYMQRKNGINEQEFLLPPNSTFKLCGKHISHKYNTIYECTLVNQ